MLSDSSWGSNAMRIGFPMALSLYGISSAPVTTVPKGWGTFISRRNKGVCLRQKVGR